MSKTTAEQLIMDIDRRYPNTYSFEDKKDWINEALKETYKDLAIEEFYSFDTIPNERIYVLPQNCTIDMINSVEITNNPVVNGITKTFKTLKFARNNETMVEPSYYAGTNENQIGIYPIPEEKYRVNLYYRKQPTYVMDKDDFIDIDDRYTNLVKYSVLSTIAMSGHNPDSEVANQYIMLYNNLVREVNQAKYEHSQKYTTIRDELVGRLRSRRRRL